VPKAPTSTHEVQAVVEGVDLLPGDPDAADTRLKVKFCGEEYAIADEVAGFAVWKFARATVDGDTDGLQLLAAKHTLLQECIAPDEWARFQRHALAKKADGDDLMAVINQVMAALAARPTRRPSGSSTGPPPTPPNSKDSSSTGDTPYPGTGSGGTPPGRWM
jgi:hypothetical protein